jgi:hypothetical protein
MNTEPRTILKNKWLISCLVVLFLLALLPIVPHIYSGASWQGVPSTFYQDAYYYARLKEIKDGYPLIGNPYFYEHRGEVAPAFFIPDAISALPLLAGLSLPQTLAFNFCLWTLVFGVLLYILFRRLKLPEMWCALGVIFTYSQVYYWILRPVSMQVVHPVFILLLLAFVLWWQHPSKLTLILFLSGSAALTVYDYQYLAQITAVFLLGVGAYIIYMRDWARLRPYALAGIISVILTVPAIFFTLTQLDNPNYWDTMARTGLIHTRLPTAESLYIALEILSVVTLICLIRIWTSIKVKSPIDSTVILHFIFMGGAIVFVGGSSVITGLDLETASHVSRFAALWLAIGTVLAVYLLYVVRHEFAALPSFKKIVIATSIFLVIVANYRFAGKVPSMFLDMPGDIIAVRSYEAYMPALRFLDKQDTEPKVVLVDPNSHLGPIIPIYTKNYVLYVNHGILHFASRDEIEERYLTAAAFTYPTLESIGNDVRSYGGVGVTYHEVNTINRPVKLCKLLRLPVLGYECGEMIDAKKFNETTFARMYKRYIEDVQPNLMVKLQKYHVTYFMKDMENDLAFRPELIKNIKQIYSDGRFSIYRLEEM